MIHPRLSISAMCTFNWSFDQDFALWTALGTRHAGLLISKIADDPLGKMTRLKNAGIRSSTVICPAFDLRKRDSWDKTRAGHAEIIDAVAATGGHSIYFTPGRTTDAPWDEVLDVFAEAVAPTVAHARKRGVLAAIEPTLRTDVSFVNTLRDSVDVAERTGIGLVADFGNMWMERDTRALFKRAMPHIALMQICDVPIGSSGKPPPSGRAQMSEGELPLRRLMQEVLDAGYKGVFDLEVLGPLIEAEGYDTSLRRGVESASALLTEMGV